MLISLNWIRDFVDLPPDLDPHELAERFTMTTAEVEGVEQIDMQARGLIAAKVTDLQPVPERRNLWQAVLQAGQGKQIETVTAAPDLEVGDVVLYAPPGAHLSTTGEIGETTVAGLPSTGLILSAEMVGIALGANQAVFLPPETEPGMPVPPGLLDDQVIEVDNKSITHRPDLWGHYGIAREVAAMYRLPLKPYPIVDLDELEGTPGPVVPIEIDDGQACPRYSGLMM